MAFNPVFIKPARLVAKNPELKNNKVLHNAINNIETSIVIDLNILSKMNKVIKGDIAFNDSGLKDMVKTLNKVRGLCLSPGFAFNEADAEFLTNINDSYEDFLVKYCKDYIDHPGAIKTKLETNKPTQFNDLKTADKYVNSITYLTILKIQLISRLDASLRPEEKFAKLISYLDKTVDIVGAIEVEAAKYVFCDLNTIKDVKFRAFCNKIKSNFKKGGNTADKLLQKCLNSARDIVYYRITASQQNSLIDGKVQDCWLLTADDGLANLTSSIYFVPQGNGQDSKYITYNRHKEQEKSNYWKYCDKLALDIVEQRHRYNIQFEESDFDRLLGEIKVLENAISELYETVV